MHTPKNIASIFMKFQYFQYFELFSASLHRVELRLVPFGRGNDSLQNSMQMQFFIHVFRFTRHAVHPKYTSNARLWTRSALSRRSCLYSRTTHLSSLRTIISTRSGYFFRIFFLNVILASRNRAESVSGTLD